MFKTFEETKKYCIDNGIQMVDFKMIDIHGRWRHVTLPTDRFVPDTMVYGIGFDGSNYGFAPVEKSDMIFIPDLTTAALDTFVEIPTLSMIGDVKVINGEGPHPFDQEPRNVARHAEEFLRASGIADEMRIGPEFEFHIFDRVGYNTNPHSVGFRVDTSQAEWNSGDSDGNNHGYCVANKGGYHITSPHDVTYDLRSKICTLLEARGVPVKYHHHEVGGPGQVEIETEFGSLLEMADRTMILKYVVKNAAASVGKTATFMPKPLYAEAGNGMHVHMHLFKDGKPLFYDKEGYSGLSLLAHYFIGGILAHAPSLCGFTNPSTNSFKRLVPGYEAPVTIGYATANRSAVIRIPAYATAPEQKRFELRSPDGTCNPYYAYSAILMAGLDGVENQIDPREHGWGPYDFNLYTLSPEEKAKIHGLPKTLDEALDALEEDHYYLTKGNVFPEKLIQVWVDKKRSEARRVNQVPHPAEYELYYDL
ncbi:MAG: type I glutamate--ammonia ligase [Bacillota bacterium]|nr:type I glutamate--ammonia ligase [Bacillota bacterium]